MKKVNMRTLLLFVLFLCVNAIYAQQAICIKDDCEVEDETGTPVTLFSNSTLKIEEIKSYVRITNVTSNFDQNQQVGIYQGAELECLTPDETDLLKVKFKDNTGKTRVDVDGVKSNIQKLTKYKVLLEDKTLYISEELCNIVDNVQSINLLDVFSYSKEDNCLHVLSQNNMEVVVNGKKTYCGENQNVTIDNISQDATIRVIYSEGENKYLDCEVNVSEVKPYTDDIPKPDLLTILKDNSIYVCVGCVIFLVIIAVALFILRKKKTKKVSKNKSDNDWGSDEEKKIDEIEKYTEGINVSQLKIMVEEIKSQSSTIVTRLDSIDIALDNYKKKNDTEKILRSKDGEIKTLNTAKEKIEQDFNSYKKTCEKEKIELNNQITSLQAELSEALKVDGAISLNGTAGFVAGISELLFVGRKTEKVIMDYISQLNDSDSSKFAYFVKRYVSTIDSEKRDRWNSILSTLSIKGYVNDAEAIKYLSAKGCESDDAKLDWLKKFVYEEFLQDYLSALTVMLESIKASKTYGLTQSAKKDIQKDIDNLISASKKNGITIHYVQLGKTLNDYANIEIGSKIPNGVEVAGKETNVPVLVVKYGMSSDKSSKSSKTELVQID